MAAEIAGLREAVARTWAERPTGGTRRENQAWRNGYLEAVEVFEDLLDIDLGTLPDAFGAGQDSTREGRAG